MFLLVAAIASAVALGIIIAYAAIVTVKWIAGKVKEKLRQKNVAKVAMADLTELISVASENCDNEINIDALEELSEQNYTHVMASLDEDNKIVDKVELIKSENYDSEVDQMINKTGEGMILINA